MLIIVQTRALVNAVNYATKYSINFAREISFCVLQVIPRVPLKLYTSRHSSCFPSCRYSYTDAFTPHAGPTHVVKNYTVKC